jgi:hypothetical protein
MQLSELEWVSKSRTFTGAEFSTPGGLHAVWHDSRYPRYTFHNAPRGRGGDTIAIAYDDLTAQCVLYDLCNPVK